MYTPDDDDLEEPNQSDFKVVRDADERKEQGGRVGLIDYWQNGDGHTKSREVYKSELTDYAKQIIKDSKK